MILSKLSDTSNEVEEIQIELIRKASVSKRISAMASLSRTVRNLSRRAIARANPHFSKQDIDIAFVELHYGQELAQKLKEHLKNRANGKTL